MRLSINRLFMLSGGDVAGASLLPPTVAIDYPTTGMLLPAGEPVAVTMTANDPDGSVTLIQVYLGDPDAGGTLLGNASGNTYTWIPTEAQVGDYDIYAVATDNAANTAKAGPVSVTVTTLLLDLTGESFFTRNGSLGYAGATGGFVPATYQTSATTLATADTDVIRFENRGDGNGALYLQERDATNYFDDSEDLSAASWTKTNATITTNVSAGPLNNTSADAVTFTGAGHVMHTQAMSNSVTVTVSGWLRVSSGTGTARFRVVNKSNAAQHSPDLALTTTWTPFKYSVNVGGGGTDPSAGVANGSDNTNRTIEVACLMFEISAWKSSYTPSSGGNKNRDADCLTFLSAQVPSALLSVRQRVSVWPEFGSADMVSGDAFWLLSIKDAGEGYRIRHNGTDVRLEVLRNGAIHTQSSALTFLPDVELIPVVDPSRGTATVRGADPPAAAAPWTWPAGYGARVGGVLGEQGNEFAGRIKEWRTVVPTNPSASFSSPANGATLTVGTPPTITVNSSDAIGIARVDIYDGNPASGGTLLGTATGTTTANYIWWLYLTHVGAHTIWARVFNADGFYVDVQGPSVTVQDSADAVEAAVNALDNLRPAQGLVIGRTGTKYLAAGSNAPKDFSINARHATSIAADDDAATATIGLNTVLDFDNDDGTNGDAYSAPAPWSGSVTKFAVFWVMRRTVADVNVRMVQLGGSSLNVCATWRSGNVMRFYCGTGSTYLLTGALGADTNWHLYCVEYDGDQAAGSRAKVYIDDMTTPISTTETPANGVPATMALSGSTTIGRGLVSGSPSEPADMQFGGQLVLTGSALDATARNNIKTQLQTIFSGLI